MTDHPTPHPECVKAALRNGTVDPRERTLELREAVADLLRPPFTMWSEWQRTGSTRSADAMQEWSDKVKRAEALLTND